MAATETLPIYKETYKLVNLILDNVPHLPKMHRFTLGDRMVTKVYEALEYVHRANASAKDERIAWLEKYLTEINILNSYIRICNERNFISTGKAVAMFQVIGNIMKQIAGWKNYTGKQ